MVKIVGKIVEAAAYSLLSRKNKPPTISHELI
jgi:hypothetical protein